MEVLYLKYSIMHHGVLVSAKTPAGHKQLQIVLCGAMLDVSVEWKVQSTMYRVRITSKQ